VQANNHSDHPFGSERYSNTFSRTRIYKLANIGDDDVLEQGAIIGERYVIDSLIARGGMGAVYRALDQKLENKYWAIKEISNQQINKQQFLDEARILTGLSHPYIPQVVDYFEMNDNSYSYLVMDLIRGNTLQEIYLNENRVISLGKVVKHAIQICEVLAYLHEQPTPIIFRDLKPANIMLDEHGNIQLIDFGIARRYKAGQITDTVGFGTIAYMSPEQMDNKQSDHRSDLYSLGATLYYLLSGGKYVSSMYVGNGLNEMAIPDELKEIILKLLAADPSGRYQSARAAKEPLERLALSISIGQIQQPERILPIEESAEVSAARQGHTTVLPRDPYSVQATHATPALIIYLIDVSGSMNQPLAGKRRIDVVREALMVAIKQMVFRSTKGSRLVGRYRVAIIAYSDEVYDLLGGIKSIDEIGKMGTLPEFSPKIFTDTAKAFEYAEALLIEELPKMTQCPAPLICHMTDGEYTGEDPEPIVRRIQGMMVPDGNVLIENIFIDDALMDAPIQDARKWKGIMPDTVLKGEVSNKLKNMSSLLPESYRLMMMNSSYSIGQGAIMMLPGTTPELVALGFQMSAATPIR